MNIFDRLFGITDTFITDTSLTSAETELRALRFSAAIAATVRMRAEREQERDIQQERDIPIDPLWRRRLKNMALSESQLRYGRFLGACEAARMMRRQTYFARNAAWLIEHAEVHFDANNAWIFLSV